jgi:hypothetical protein
VSTNLARIGVSAREHPDQVFTSLYHHIADIDHLRACYRLLKGNKAVGVDEVTRSMYAEDLDWTLAFSTVLRWSTQKALHDGQIIAHFGRFLASCLQQGACMFIAVLTHHISQRI